MAARTGTGAGGGPGRPSVRSSPSGAAGAGGATATAAAGSGGGGSGGPAADDVVTLAIDAEKRVATVTLNRPERLNAINDALPSALERCIEAADEDDRVRVIVLTGAGRAFCAGYDLVDYAQTPGANVGAQDVRARPYDPGPDFRMMSRNTRQFMSMFRATKPVIAKVRGFAVAGGSDIALCADLVVMAEDAKIGYPPGRVWGIATTAQWVSRVGAERAKGILLSGDLVEGKDAERIGLVWKSVPASELDAAVDTLAARLSTVPVNQLMMNKLVVNNFVEHQGIHSSQRLATVFDGLARHSPEGAAFKERAEAVGFQQAVKERDAGTFDWTGGKPFDTPTALAPRAKL